MSSTLAKKAITAVLVSSPAHVRLASHLQPTLHRPAHSSLQHPFSRTHQNRYAVEILSKGTRAQYAFCLSAAAKMKNKGIKPNLLIYNTILAAAAEDGFWLDAWSILDDMLLMGIRPNAMTFNHLIHAARFKQNHHVSRVLKKMGTCGTKPNAQTLSLLITRCAAEKNLESAIRHLLSAPQQNIIPNLHATQSVIILAARNNHARLALDLAEWFEQISTRRLEETVWVNCLIAAAETSYIDGILKCWNIITRNFKTLLDQGLCISILNAAARHGQPQLATETLQMLQNLNIPPQEHHFAAIVEAFSREGQIKEAILVVDLMNTSGITASLETTRPISEHIQGDIGTLDSIWKIIHDMSKEGRQLDISIPRAFIDAVVRHGDLPRAFSVYKMLSEMNISPDLPTFNLLLQGCVRAADREMGDTFLADVKAAKIKPDQDTYESMIRLCLTQNTYEDAFFYLEEMKAAGFKPSPSLYTTMVDKCLACNDLRYEIAVQEMAECGYDIPKSLKHRVDGTSYFKADHNNSPTPSLSEAERQFIERGGLVHNV